MILVWFYRVYGFSWFQLFMILVGFKLFFSVLDFLSNLVLKINHIGWFETRGKVHLHVIITERILF